MKSFSYVAYNPFLTRMMPAHLKKELNMDEFTAQWANLQCSAGQT